MMSDVTDHLAPFVITIDGPAASGKSSVARGVADALEIPFVSSGLFYRAATLLVLGAGIDPLDEAGVLSLLSQHDVSLKALAIEPNRILIDGEDKTAALHTDDVDAAVSAVSKHPRVRDWVRGRLQEVEGAFVVEGRDMGTAVFPGAAHKFYLTAPAEVRAQRRVGERAASLFEVTEAIKRRDKLDAEQSVPAPDALHVATEALGLEGVIATILKRVRPLRAR